MQLKVLMNYLEEVVPLEIQESYDNCGLLIGDPQQEIGSGLLCLDITEEVIHEAIRQGINLVISHHPLIFHGIKNLSPEKSVDRIILLAIRHEIAIYAMHTNLDKVWGGVSFQIGERLGLKDLEFLKISPEKSSLSRGQNRFQNSISQNFYGLGVIGCLEVPLNWEKFSALLKEKMQVRVIRHTATHDQLIHKIGICGGSGSDLIPEALEKGCEVFVTADLKYHQFFLDSTRMILADIGHFESEQFSPELIRKIISNKFPTFDLSLTKLNTNPIYYSY